MSTAVAIRSNVYYLPHSPPFPTLTSSSSSARRRRAPPPPLLCALPPSGLLGGRSCKVLQGAVRSCRRQGAAGKELPPAQAVGKELPPPSMCWRANKATRKKPGEQCGAEEARRTRRRGRNPANKATAEEARRRRAWRPLPRHRGLESHRRHLAAARAPGGGNKIKDCWLSILFTHIISQQQHTPKKQCLWVQVAGPARPPGLTPPLVFAARRRRCSCRARSASRPCAPRPPA